MNVLKKIKGDTLIQALAGYTVERTLREDQHAVLVRARREADGASVLVLWARAGQLDAELRLEHEYALRAELDQAWAARPLALLRTGCCVALVLSDSGAAPLACVPGQPLALPALLRLAIGLTAALAELHRQGIVHQDLRPEHILVDPAGGAVWLTGFGSAAHLRSLPRAPQTAPSGSLQYMAPEQTGRTNQIIDTRTDLYSLGVLLYQLLCGELPFSAGDAAQWIDCHVAREPLAPQLRWPGADASCSAIVLKLLSKSAGQRYQSAPGLLADLQHCQALLEANGHIAPFELACNDGAARLQTPATLFGRATQLALLEEAALHVAAGGAPELIIISGNAGTGKSALLAALQRSDAVAGAIVVPAKFERQSRDIPYATLAQAFQKLVRQMLGQSEAALANWRRSLQDALGANAALMLELIPELKFVIGEPRAPVQLAPLEAQARFQTVFRQFLGAITGADSMLLLTLDDLQWIDPASLNLLAHLVTHPDVRRVLVVGAYRASEVDATHPLAVTHDSMKLQGAGVRRVVLQALSRLEAAELVAAALACAPAHCAALADLVYAKTAGNPFFTLQFLARLLEGGLLRYAHADQAWTWDAAAIGAREFSDNVIDLMIARLQQLPGATLEVVKLLACLGHDASIETLAQAAGMSSVETDECLWPASRLGLVMREPRAYRFMHDRVQEAAYSLIARATLPERHLHIGRLLLAQLEPAALEQQVFAAVSHLNRAREAIDDPAELAALARLNTLAGKRARGAVAYDAARNYFALAAGLAPAGAWQDDFDATFALHCALAECEYLSGNLERADSLFGELAEHARSRLEITQVALMRVALYQVWGRFGLAADVALEALALFGVTFPDNEGEVAAALDAERAAVLRNMAARTIAALEDDALSADPEIGLVTELFSDMGSSVFSARPQLYSLLAVKALNFTLRFGSTATCCMTYSRYAILLVSWGAIPDAFAFSELALRMADRSATAARRVGRLVFVHGAYVHSWRKPMAGSVALLERAFQACQEAGDLPHAGYAAHIATWNSYEAGAPLAEVQQRSRSYQRFAQQQGNAVLMQLLRGYEQLTLCLQGATDAPGSVDDHRFNADAALAAMEKANFGAAWARFHLMRQVAAFTFGRYHEALQAAEAAAGVQHFFLASVHESTHHFYHALTMTALYADVSQERQGQFMAALRDKHRRLADWAGHCPGNFANRHLLVGAELARVEGRDMEAMRAYDGALVSARGGGFVHHEALAGELAANFYRARGFDKIALAYAREALQAYARWGAYGKMRDLERQFDGLVRVSSPQRSATFGPGADPGPGLSPGPGANAIPGAGTGANLSAGGPALDLMAVLRASQQLSGAADGAALAGALLRIAIEHSGASRALLILPAAGGWRCAARASMGAGGLLLETHEMALPAAGLPESLLQFVLRTRETVLLDDALASIQFRDDPFVRRACPRSVLCMPLLRHGVLAGVLYLENALAPGLFTPVRTLVLELIGTQAAISLRQAELTDALRADNDAQGSSLEAGRRTWAFFAGLGPQLRAPLGAIACASSLALRTELDPAQRAYVEQIELASRELVQMANDGFELARFEAGPVVLESLIFSLPALAAEVHAGALRACSAEGARLRLELDDDLPRYVVGDPLRLGRALECLLAHALEADPRATVALQVRLVGRDGAVACLRFLVSGSAAGVPAGQAEALLGPFRQARSAGPAHAGSGLGMALAQHLVRSMGGLIESNAGTDGGQAFGFLLDLACASEAPAPSRGAAAGNERERAKLQRLGQMLAANSGDTAQYFESIRPALAGMVEPHTLARLSAQIASYQFADARRLLAEVG